MKALLFAVLVSWVQVGWAAKPKAHPSPSASPSPAAAAKTAPSIASLLKPAEFQALTTQQEIISRARLTDEGSGLKRYSFFAAMQLRSGLKKTREVLTDYKVYSKLVPYISKTEFEPKTKVLEVQGGIWKYHLASWIQFEDQTERWIRFKIIAGHFQGLDGNMYFEPQGERGEKGTVVYFDGSLLGSYWPPKWVIERGAEIVFGFTARRMRSYILSTESSTNSATGAEHEQGLPQPRSRFSTGQ